MTGPEVVGVNIAVPFQIHQRAKINATKKGMKLKDYIIHCIEELNNKYDEYRIKKGW